MNEGTPSIMNVIPVGNVGITESEQIEMTNIFARRLRGSMNRMSLPTLGDALRIFNGVKDEELRSQPELNELLSKQGAFKTTHVRLGGDEANRFRYWYVAGVARDGELWYLAKITKQGMEKGKLGIEVIPNIGPKEIRDIFKKTDGEWFTDYFHICAALVGYADVHAKDRLEKYQEALLLQQGMEAELRLLRRMINPKGE